MSLVPAHDTGALKKDDLARITVDTTVQPKNITHPTDAKLILTAIEKLGEQAKAAGVPLRQSYARVAKGAALTRELTGREIERVYADKGYRGHDAPKPLRVFLSGQRRGVHGQIKRELRRRSAIEAAIGHMKTDGHLGRNFLKGRHGDHANAVLTAVGYNFRLILNWLRLLLRKILDALFTALSLLPQRNPAC